MKKFTSLLLFALCVQHVVTAQTQPPRPLVPGSNKNDLKHNNKILFRMLPESKRGLKDRDSQPKPNNNHQPVMPGAKANKNLPVCDYGTQVGATYHDYQYILSPKQGILKNPNGTIALTYQLGRKGVLNSRLIGYNLRSPSNTWCAGATINDTAKYIATGDNSVGVIGASSPFRNFATARQHLLSKRATSATMFKTSTPAGYNIATHTVAPNGIPAGVNDSAALEARITVLDIVNSACRPANGLNYQRKQISVSHPAVAGDGNGNVYAVSYTTDTAGLGLQNFTAAGTFIPLVFLKSTDNGATWTQKIIPNISRDKGFGSTSVAGPGYAIDCRGQNISIVTNIRTLRPNSGLACILIKSTDGGNTFSTRIIDYASFLDTNRCRPSTFTGMYNVLFNDACFSVLIDEYNNTHVTMGRGYMGTDDNGDTTSFVGFRAGNGGFIFPQAGRLMYWAEHMPEGTQPQLIGEFVDVNRNGTIAFPDQTSSSYPNSYQQSGMSMGNLSIDQYGRMYVVYSAFVEGTDQVADKITRDIYVITSNDYGRHWSHPINVAALAGADDGLTGGAGATEEAYPMSVKRIDSDNIIHTIFQSDEVSGANADGMWEVSYTASNWRANVIQYYGINTADVWGYRLYSRFPEAACGGSSNTRAEIWLPEGGKLPAGATVDIQLDTSALGTFNPARGTLFNLGSFTVQGGKDDYVVNLSIPAGLGIGVHKIRAVSNVLRPDTTLEKFYESGAYDFTVTNSPPAALNVPSLATINKSDTLCAGEVLMATTLPGAGTGYGNSVTFKWELQNSGGAVIVGTGDEANIKTNPYDTVDRDITILVSGVNGCGTGPAVSKVFRTKVNRITRNGDTLIAPAATGSYKWTLNGNARPDLSGRKIVVSAADTQGTYCVTAPGIKCAACFQTVAAVAITDLKDQLPAETLSLYPNPADHELNVVLNSGEGLRQNADLVLTDMLGKTHLSEQIAAGESTHKLSTTALRPGIYLLRVKTGSTLIQEKIVINR